MRVDCIFGILIMKEYLYIKRFANVVYCWFSRPVNMTTFYINIPKILQFQILVFELDCFQYNCSIPIYENES